MPDSPVSDAVQDSAFLRACRREPVPHIPVWFMRQAGRSLPEYRQARGTTSMLEACRTPDLVTEITLQPVRRYGVDAAILYSDIVVPLASAGIDLDIVPGVGPVIAHPVRTAADVDALPELDPAQVEPVRKAVSQLVAELGATPLIGFAGAPFTLASYLVEGGPSRAHEHTKAMLYGDPGLWNALLDKLSRITATFLRVQVEAGAAAVQLFDSWVGCLPVTDYVRAVQPHSRRVLDAVDSVDVGRPVPRIHFGVGTGELLAEMGRAGADVVGVDFRVPLHEASRRIGPHKAVQGNLDPAVLFAPWQAVDRLVRATVDAGHAAPGHVFNLGHGVMPETDPEVLHRVVDLVHELS